MTSLKLNKTPIIILSVIGAIFLVTGIVFALLPESVYMSWNDYSPRLRFTMLGIFVFLAVIMLITIWGTVKKQKDNIERVYAMIRNTHENLLFLDGWIMDTEKSSENAKRTFLSILGGIISAIFLGIGFYKIYFNENARTFILCNQGMYVIDPKGAVMPSFYKATTQHFKMTEKKNRLILEIPNFRISYKMRTTNLDVNTEELIAKFKEMFIISDQNEQQTM